MKKLSVLTLIDMNPNKLGALEEYALHLSNALIQKGHFAVVGFSKPPPDWLREKFKAFGIEVLEIRSTKPILSFIIDMREAIHKYGINILHATFYPFYSPLLILSTIGSGCKLIYSDQESRILHPSNGVKAVFRFLRNRYYQKYFYAIVADAEFVRLCQIKDHFSKPDKVPVIYNGVNLKRFRKANPDLKAALLKEFNIPYNSSVIVTIAQCIWAKGLNNFIDAASIIVKERPNTIFFIVGEGYERSKLENQTLALGLQNNIIFTGMRVDTESFLSVADIFVLLSIWEEAFAFTLLEAMASGCPVVATHVGAIPESVKDGVTGILVPPRDANAAANAILKLLNDDVLRLKMSLAARKRVEENFSLEQWVNKTIELYEKAINT
jgi:glycosyltransferase involved in cell wall biosynthesis